jgi:hypothetical protein
MKIAQVNDELVSIICRYRTLYGNKIHTHDVYSDDVQYRHDLYYNANADANILSLQHQYTASCIPIQGIT